MNPFDEFDIIKEYIPYNKYMEGEVSYEIYDDIIYDLMLDYEKEFKFEKETAQFIIKKMVFTKNKLCHGEYIMYLDSHSLESQKLIMKANYNYGLLEGKKYYYDYKDNICQSDNYVNGNLHGVCLKYDSEGNLEEESTYHHGQAHGKTIDYKNSRLKEINTYSYGKKNGYCITFYNSEYIESIEETYNGETHGSYIEYEDLEEAIENKDSRGGIYPYPKVITYQKYIHGIGCADDKNKDKGKFELYAIGLHVQEDNDYIKEFYEDLYLKYKNIVHMNVEK